MRRKVINLLQDNINYRFFVNVFKNSNFEHNIGHLNNIVPALSDNHQQHNKLEDVYSDRDFNFINTESRKLKVHKVRTWQIAQVNAKNIG